MGIIWEGVSSSAPEGLQAGSSRPVLYLILQAEDFKLSGTMVRFVFHFENSMEIGEEPEWELEVLLGVVAVVLGNAWSGLAEWVTQEKGGLEKC